MGGLVGVGYHAFMGQRRHHYESAFEQYLRERRIPYVMVDEAKKALLPADASLQLVPTPTISSAAPHNSHAPQASDARPIALKSFDFVLYGEPFNYLAEIKGRRLSSRVRQPKPPTSTPPRRKRGETATLPLPPPPPPTEKFRRPTVGRLESWVTRDDLDSLTHWQALFGQPFRAAFIFLYWCDEIPPAALFEEMFEHHGRWYAVRAIELDHYKTAMKERSTRWRTVHLPSQDFDRLSRPLCGGRGRE